MKFCSTTVSFLEDPLVLRKYLGPSTDIGPAMTAKILTPKDAVVHHNTYRLLTPGELADPAKQDGMKTFLQTTEEWWGTCLVRDNLRKLDSLTGQNHSHT